MAGKAATKSQADKPSASRKRSSSTAKKRSTPRKPKTEATATELSDVESSQASFTEQYGTHG